MVHVDKYFENNNIPVKKASHSCGHRLHNHNSDLKIFEFKMEFKILKISVKFKFVWYNKRRIWQVKKGGDEKMTKQAQM